MMFAGCADEGPAHSHYHNCFSQLFNQLDLVDIVWGFFSCSFFFHVSFSPPVISEVALRVGSDPSKAVTRVQTGPRTLLFFF